MVGGIKASSPGMMSTSADLFLDLPTLSAPSGEERRTGAPEPHRSSALNGAAAALTVACTRVVFVPLSWSWTWSHHPQGRARAAAPAFVDTLGRTPYEIYVELFPSSPSRPPRALRNLKRSLQARHLNLSSFFYTSVATTLPQPEALRAMTDSPIRRALPLEPFPSPRACSS